MVWLLTKPAYVQHVQEKQQEKHKLEYELKFMSERKRRTLQRGSWYLRQKKREELGRSQAGSQAEEQYSDEEEDTASFPQPESYAAQFSVLFGFYEVFDENKTSSDVTAILDKRRRGHEELSPAK